MTRSHPLAAAVARHNQRRELIKLAEIAVHRQNELGAHAAPGDMQRLRNIPAIGKGTGGAVIPGTRPDHEAGRRRRKRRP